MSYKLPATAQFLAQAAWFIDPQNGSDGYDGTSATFTSGVTGPLKTWAHLAALWGTYAPRLRQNTTITFVSSHTDDSDPVYFRPLIENGSLVILQGTTPTIVATGTMGTVTPLNRSTPQLLNAVLPTGAIAAGQMIQNNTHSSRAWIYANVTGTTWAISSPIAPVTPPHNTSTPPVVSWSTSDTYTIYQPIAVNIAELIPTFDYAVTNNFLSIYQLQILDPSGQNLSQLSVKPGTTSFYEVSTQRSIMSPVGNNSFRAYYYNCDFLGPIFDLSNMEVAGGQLRVGIGSVSEVGNFYFSDDFIMGATMVGPITVANGTYIESGKLLNVSSGGDQFIPPSFFGPIWGPGALNILPGCTLTYTGTATANFLVTGGIKIATSAVAYSLTNNTLNSNITITAANLDAPAGPAGFGGTAFVIGGGCITNYSSTQTSALTQAAWYIDPANGYDGYNGTSATFTSGVTGPLKTWAHLVSLWGTYSPRLRQNTTITFVTGHTDNTDPVYFNPYLEAGAYAVIQGTLGAAQQIATGTLGTVTAKNRTTPQLLNAILTSGLSVGQLIVNATHSSRAWLYKNVTGNTWAISQPLAPISIPSLSAATEVDTWTTGDTYTVYQPVQVNIAQVNPNYTDYSSGFNTGVFLYQLQVFDPRGATDDLLTLGQSGVAIMESGVQRVISQEYNNQFLANNVWTNCDLAGGAYISGFARTIISAGMLRSAGGFLVANAVSLDKDVIIATLATTDTGGNYGTVYIESGKTLTVGAASTTTFTGTPVIWGLGTFLIVGTGRVQYPGGSATTTFVLVASLSGTFNVSNGSPNVTASTSQTGVITAGSVLTFGGGTATGTYTVLSASGTSIILTANYTGTSAAAATATGTSIQGQIKINGLTTAFSSAGTNPVTMYGAIPLIAANLDATAGTNGFGGNAFNLGGGSLTSGAT